MSHDTNEAVVKAVEKVMALHGEEERKAAGLPKPKSAPKLENAIADMKRQLRAEPKSEIIRQWIGMYAQIIKQAKEINELKSKLNEFLNSGPSGSEQTGAGASKEVK